MLTSSDRYFLEHSAGSDQVGIYSLGYKIAMIVQIIVSAVQAAWSAQMFAIAKESNAPRRYARILTYYAATIGFLGLGVSVVARDVIFIMADPAYHEGYIVVPLIDLSRWLRWGQHDQRGLNVKGPRAERADHHRRRDRQSRPELSLTALRHDGRGLVIPDLLRGPAVIEVMVNQRHLAPGLRIPADDSRSVGLGRHYVASLGIDTGNAWLNMVFKGIVVLVFPLVLYALRFFDASELSSIAQVVTRLTGRLRARSKNESLNQADK